MRLTQILCKYRPEFIGKIPKFRGKVDIGKDRYVPKVGSFDKIKKLEELLEEERTMSRLSTSYITVEEERALLQHQGRVVPEYFDDYMHMKIEKPMQQKYAADFIKELDKSRRFEEMN